MVKLSKLLNTLIIGNPADAQVGAAARLKNVTLNNMTGIPTSTTNGPDLQLEDVSSPGTLRGQFRAEKVWNAVWNDYADFQKLNDKLVYGMCYRDTFEGAILCTERCQKSVIGIATDTFGMAVGQGVHPDAQVPIAVAGWVLAFVDKEYECGTPLTNDEKGYLTEMTLQEKRDYPERLVAIYKKKELNLTFGTEGKEIQVNGRHWVKVK
ncbi:MAG: hypothetical protein ACK41T_08935 [Pseudobdellovibrio sp.]